MQRRMSGAVYSTVIPGDLTFRKKRCKLDLTGNAASDQREVEADGGKCDVMEKQAVQRGQGDKGPRTRGQMEEGPAATRIPVRFC